MADTLNKVDETVNDTKTEPIRLTQTVKKGGCAAKIAAGTLSNLLAALPRQQHPDLLVGTDFLDDAAVWRVNETQAMVQTLDFFTPVLDDPYDFGAVAAANALSDVFAMGATPTTALTILAYPLETLPPDILRELMAGAVAKINEAGALLVGGHSIDDDTLKLGFSVTGLGHPERLWSNRGAQVGDVLILTKAVGTGTLTGAVKNDELRYEDISEAVASMKTLNRLDLPDDLHSAVHAATDVTGFGVLGQVGRGIQVFAQGRLEVVHGRNSVRDDLGQRVAWLAAAGQLHRRLRPEGGAVVVFIARCIAQGLRCAAACSVHVHCGCRRATIAGGHRVWGPTRIPGPVLERMRER